MARKRKARKLQRRTSAADRRPDGWSVAMDEPVSPPKPDRFASVRAQLRTAVERYLGIGVDVEDGDEGIAFAHGKKRIVYLWKREAAANTIYGNRKVVGNFLEPGEHWDRLRALLIELHAVDTTPASGRPPVQTTLLPTSLSVGQRAMALAAGKRIQTERVRAFDRRTILDIDEDGRHSIEFEPIVGHDDGTTEVPFRYAAPDGSVVSAALRLGSTDPPAIAAFEAISETELAGAWVIALVAFADLTCFEDVVDASRGPRAAGSRPQRGRSHPPARLLPIRRRRPAGSGGSFARSLRPIGRTAQSGVSYVSGHRRRLASGRSSSLSARRAALDVGIHLGLGETWVQSHARGLPPDFVLHFRWQPPEGSIA
jgi:hypothetical protein